MDAEKLNRVGKRLGQLTDLPKELISQLQLSEVEDQALTVIREDFEGIANIDEILVGFYKRFAVIHNRRTLANKLYRMSKAGLLHSVRGKKGVYSLEPLKI